MVTNTRAAEASSSRPDGSASKSTGTASAHRPLINGLRGTPTPNNATKSRSSSGVSSPNWRGPVSDATQTVVNGDPFKHGAGPSDGGSKVSVGPVLKPTQRPAVITDFHKDTESDDEPSRPVIVATPVSTAVSAPAEASSSKGKQRAVQEPIDTSSPSFSPTRKAFFTTDFGPNVERFGHYLKVPFLCGAPGVEPTMDTAYCAFGWADRLRGISPIIQPEGARYPVLLVCFDDLRYAKKAIYDSKVIDTMDEPTYVSQSEYAAATFHHGAALPTALYDGQVIFAARFEGEGTAFNSRGLFSDVVAIARSYGRLLEVADAHISAGTWEFRVEFYAISAAKNAVADLTEASPAKIKGWSVFARELIDNNSLVPMTPHKIIHGVYGEYAASPTGRTSWKIDEDGNTILGAAPIRVPKAQPRLPTVDSLTVSRGGSTPTPELPPTGHFSRDYVPSPRSQSWNGPSTTTNLVDPMSSPSDQEPDPEKSQVVDIQRIVDGKELRTTLMLRNLPNVINALYLKEKILDIATKKKYDFSYLRYDFEKGLNVGYAFVNFTHPSHIIAFVDHWTDAVWAPTLHLNNRTRPRMAEFAFATTQGVECSITKFRNSSVMLEAPPYRPKLWWTAENAEHPSLIGTERPFPPPDNPAKLQRSCDNAGQVGLFAPARRNDGRGGRGDRGRQQRSQFDRGTLAQIQEDAIMNNIPGAVYPGHYQPPMGYNFANGAMIPVPPHLLGLDSLGYESPVHAVGLVAPGPFNGFNPNFFNNGFNAASTIAGGEHAMSMGGAVQSPTFAGPSRHGSYHGSRQQRPSYDQYHNGSAPQPERYYGHQNGQVSGHIGYYPPPSYQ